MEYLQERGFSNLLILEGSWVGDKTSESAEVCGYLDLCSQYGIPFVDTQKDSLHARNCKGLELKLCDQAVDLDFLINVPVSYTHLYGIDALGAMAQGLFASLLIGTILSTLGEQLGIAILVTIGGYAVSYTHLEKSVSR